MRSIITLVALLIIFSAGIAQERKIQPNWKQGDQRTIVSNSALSIIMERDTFLNTRIETKSKVKVEKATAEGYVISYSHAELEKPEISMPGMDSLEGFKVMAVFVQGLMEATEKATRKIPLQYRIARDGEAVAVVNFEETFKKFQEAVVVIMQDLSNDIKKLTGDSVDVPIGTDQIKSSTEPMKEQFKTQLLNFVNYLNQAYYEVIYDKRKKKYAKSIIAEYNVMKYGDVEMDGEIISEILEDSEDAFKVKITTRVDQESLDQAIAEHIGESTVGSRFIEDWMVIEYDPSSFWVKNFETFQHIKLDDIEIRQSETARFVAE